MRRLCVWLIASLALVAGVAPSWGAEPRGARSVKKALLLSMMVPGAGQAYMGHSGRAKSMFAAEAGVWGSFAVFRLQGSMREDNYKEAARLFAGVDRDMDDDYYYKMLAYYASSDEYNVGVMWEARQRFPDDRAKQLEFLEAEGYFGEEAWQWDSLERMNEYARVRTLSRKSYRRATLSTGFAVLNRMISMIDVYLSYKLGDDALGSARFGLGFRTASDGGAQAYLRIPF